MDENNPYRSPPDTQPPPNTIDSDVYWGVLGLLLLIADFTFGACFATGLPLRYDRLLMIAALAVNVIVPLLFIIRSLRL
jgi:hypothetical protein